MTSNTSSPRPDLLPADGSVTLFTTSWCGFCARLISQLERDGVPFATVDIEAEPGHVDFVESVNGGNRTVPTVLFADGTTATNPSLAEVRARVGA
jgi:mycoredoxin